MANPQSLAGMATRFIVVMLVVAAVSTMLRWPQPVAPAKTETSPTVVMEAAHVVPRPTWHLGFDGWYVRVDNAEIAIPSLTEQIEARRRARLAWSFSPFDDLIVHHADSQGFDWRLVAAVIFEESKFNPDSESDRGAIGLMQVRPIAAEAVGEVSSRDPDDNIRTGVRYLAQLDEMFAAAPDDDRLRLVLAAYNIGPGHVHDAQQLARRFGYDPNRWQGGVQQMLPLLERPEFNKDLANGYAKGSSTVAYVGRILERYANYQREAPNLHETTADGPSPVGSAHG